ncbi:MAG: hypothetical protein ACXWBN_14840 [Acidimicrobiales bacterium]
MPRRIDVELTSTRPDGTWTWRAAGARQPKGELDGSLLYPGAKIGDVVRADADFDIDGITITGVSPPAGARSQPDLLEIIGPPRRDDELVTTSLVGKGGRGRDDRGPREGRGDRDRGDRRGPRSPRGGPRRQGDRPPRGEGAPGREGGRPPRRDSGDRPPRRERPPRPVPEARPKAKRLKPDRTHRNEVLDALSPEQKVIAEQVLRGGIPAVRQAIEKQNEEARAAGTPEIKPEGMVTIAEQLLPGLRTAEWHDRADAALADVDEIDLRDLRSVVVAADAAARDDVTRTLAQNLREALTRRVDQEHAAWLTELTETLADGRTVRALRLSSRPPQAGSPLPAELATRLTEATNAALTAGTGPDRFATVLDALAFSPVRQQVVPVGVPAEPGDALLAAVRKLASRVPQIAALFGIEASSTRPPRSSRAKGAASGPRPVPAPPTLPPPTPAPAIEPAPVAPAIEPAEPMPAIESAEPVPAIEAAEPMPAIEPAEPVPALEPAPEPEPVAVVEPIDDAASPDNPDVIEQDQIVQDDAPVAPAAPPSPPASIDDAASPDNPDVIEQSQSLDEGELVERPEGY